VRRKERREERRQRWQEVTLPYPLLPLIGSVLVKKWVERVPRWVRGGVFEVKAMKKLIPLILLTACSAEHLKVAEQVLSAIQRHSKNSVGPSVAPNPTPTIEPLVAPTGAPTATPTPIVLVEDREPVEVKCGARNPVDGPKRGFVWKPESDTQKWAVAILPNELGPELECSFAGLPARHKGAHHDEIGTAGTRQVHILDGWTGERLEKKHGKIVVRCGCVHWSIPRPSKRVD
jgi:hypothetical protein